MGYFMIRDEYRDECRCTTDDLMKALNPQNSTFYPNFYKEWRGLVTSCPNILTRNIEWQDQENKLEAVQARSAIKIGSLGCDTETLC